MKKLIDYIVENYGVDRNTSSTILLTLLTFLLGVGLTWITSLVVKAIKRKEYRKCLKLVIGDFVKKSHKQYIANKNFSEQKGLLSGENYSFTTISNYGLKYLESVDVTEFTTNFISILKKKSPKRILKLFEVIELLRVHQSQSTLFRSELFERFEKADAIYSSNLSSLRKFHDDLLVKYNKKEIETNYEVEFILGIINIYNLWFENGQKREIENTYPEIVYKILELSKQIKPNPLNRITIDHALECKLAYENMKSIDNLLRNEMLESAWIYKKASKMSNIILKGL